MLQDSVSRPQLNSQTSQTSPLNNIFLVAFRNEKSCTVESWYEILSFLRKTVVLPFVAYELYTYNDIEEGYFHILAMAVPVLMMLLCMMNYINMAVSVIILGSLITLIGQGFINSMPFGITAGIVYFIIHFLVQEHCFVLCDHSKDIYNLGIALFLILMFRAITANDGAPWLQWIFGVFYHL